MRSRHSGLLSASQPPTAVESRSSATRPGRGRRSRSSTSTAPPATTTVIADRDTALVAVGAPAHLLGFGIAQLASTAAWPIAILGSASLGAGLAWPGYRLWHAAAASDVLLSDEYEQRNFRSPVAESHYKPHRVLITLSASN